jgi:hypothetical protein
VDVRWIAADDESGMREAADVIADALALWQEVMA